MVLKSITTFTNLAPGVPTSLPHGLVDADGRGLVPDHVEDNNADVIVLSADDTDVTVRNDGAAPVNADVLCEHWHSFNRALPPGQVDLPVQPFIPSSGTGGIAPHAATHELGGGDEIDGNRVATTLGTLTESGGNVVPDLDTHGAVWNLVLTADGWNIGVPLNPRPGMTIVMRIQQGGGGSNMVTWNAVWLWAGGGAPPTLSTALGAIDVISAMYDGTNWLANAVLDFQ